MGRLLVSKDLYEQAVPLLKKQSMGCRNLQKPTTVSLLRLSNCADTTRLLPTLIRPRILDPTAPRIMLLQALILLDYGKFSAAKDFIRKAQTLKPDDKFAAFLWSRILIEEGNYKEAIQLFTDLIAGGFEDPTLIRRS